MALALLAGAAAPATAGVQLHMGNGRVTLHATNATVRQILAEWARVGHTTIVNADKITGGLMNLDIENMPEAAALDIVLRSAGGYLAAPRPAPVATLSYFDRIVIVAATAPAAPVSRPAPAAAPQRPPVFPPGFNPGARPPFPGQPGSFTPPAAPSDDEPITNIVMPNRGGAVFNGFQQPQLVTSPDGHATPGVPEPGGQVIVPPSAPPTTSVPGATITPFGGTSIPGVIVQPQQPQSQSPGTPSPAP
jgi:hypothetical protein